MRADNVNTDQRIDKIIEAYLPDISSNLVSIDTILEKHPQDAQELRPRLEALFWLANAKQNVNPRQGFITSSRKSIERQFISIQPHGFLPRLFKRHTPQRWVFNLVTPILLIFLLVFILNSLVLSAQLSIPGDSLYSTKLALEDVKLALTLDRANKTELYIQLSRERTTELVELVLEGNYELLPSAAERMETEMIASLHAINNIPTGDQAVEQSMTSELKETLTNEIYMLELLQGSSPPAAHQGLELAIQSAQSGLMALR